MVNNNIFIYWIKIISQKDNKVKKVYWNGTNAVAAKKPIACYLLKQEQVMPVQKGKPIDFLDQFQIIDR